MLSAGKGFHPTRRPTVAEAPLSETSRAARRLRTGSITRWAGIGWIACEILTCTARAPMAPDAVGTAGTSVLTYHNDIGRTGQNINETALAPVNVEASRFGKLFSHTVDGDLYAQPLYVPNLTIPGKGLHNVVFVATEGDSVYAFDADDDAGTNAAALWHASLIDSRHGAAPGASAMNASADLGCGAILPRVGITATPVIDLASATIYVETLSKENGSAVHRLHRLNLTTGEEMPAAPVVIAPTLRDKAGHTRDFDPSRHLSRPALSLLNGSVYVAYGSHCDKPPFQGWIVAFDARSLAQKGVFITAPEHGKAGIWMSGAGPAGDSSGSLFLVSGNGWFDTQTVPARELGDSILKLRLRAEGLQLLDYFTPFDQARFSRHDGDLGSSGVLLLPDQPGEHRHLLAAAGKPGTLYLLDRDSLTAGNLHYCGGCTSDRQIVQAVAHAISGGVWNMPAYWNQTLYISGSSDVLRAFPLKNGRLDLTSISASEDTCEYPGCGLSLSAHGSDNGILWTLRAHATDSRNMAVLKAYDARNLHHILYSSDQQGERDDAGDAVKFAVPTVVNGKVYVGASGQLTVFGLRDRR